MSQSFGELIKKAREASMYPHGLDFCHRAGIHRNTLRKYEMGDRIPTTKNLEHIVEMCRIPDRFAIALRTQRDVEKAEKSGIALGLPELKHDWSALAEKIQKDLDYTLKPEQIKLSPSTRKACVRRIEIRLRAALENP